MHHHSHRNHYNNCNHHTHRYQKGVSAWLILPWVLLLVLALVLYFVLFYARTPQNTPTQLTPTIDAPAATALTDSAPNPAPLVASYHDAVQKAAVSVVNIYTTQMMQDHYDPLVRQFLQQHGYSLPKDNRASLGSGVVVSQDGYIITNAHVIDKADDIVVVLNDGRRANAVVIGTDVDSDLALIKVDLDNLIPLDFRQSPILVGDIALAIGNPFGVGQTVTQGIVSATGRTGLGVTTYEDFIQTDAAINPGNSGGALVDSNGELMGINTVIYSRSGGSMGIGFAIPASTVQKVMHDIINIGHVSRGWLGIHIGAKTKQGVPIVDVLQGAAADRAGLLPNDVVTKVHGQDVMDAQNLMRIISELSPNDSVELTVLRGTKIISITAILDERPSLVAP